MAESLQLHQGPGVNGLFLAKSEDYKLLDILMCRLGDNRDSYRVELPLEEFLQLAGYAITDANKNAVRPRLKESAERLGTLTENWTEGRYTYQNIRFFDSITYRNGCVYACFGEEMARYLLGCSTMRLPLSLLAVSGRSSHSYLLGRRCLVYDAANRDRKQQPIRVENLLAFCPRITKPAPQEKWSPSILERKVIDPFTAAMNSLVALDILTWNFREPVCREDYDGFASSIIEFQISDTDAPAPPAEPETEYTCDSFDYDGFLALR